jgi:hypothetical protein
VALFNLYFSGMYISGFEFLFERMAVVEVELSSHSIW